MQTKDDRRSNAPSLVFLGELCDVKLESVLIRIA